MDDTRERFLSAIAERLGADRIVELHLFSPIRQGVLETGVAIVAAVPASAEVAPTPSSGEEEEAGAIASGEAEEAGASEPEDDSPYASSSHTLPLPLSTEKERESVRDGVVVFTARSRLTRKGPDRGKWLFEIAETADAPLPTVEAVARGVTLRAKDLTETERLTGEQLRALLPPPQGAAQ